MNTLSQLTLHLCIHLSLQPVNPYSNNDSSCQIMVKAPVPPPINPMEGVCPCVRLKEQERRRKIVCVFV